MLVIYTLRSSVASGLPIAGCFSLLLLLLTSCTAYRLIESKQLKTPDFALVGCRVTSLTERHAMLELTVSAYNPNPIGLKNLFVDYELSSSGKRLMRGRDVRFELPPNSDATILVPAEIRFHELVELLAPLLDAILSRQVSIPITLDAVFSGTPTVYDDHQAGVLFSFEKRLTRTLDIPLPEEEIDRVRRQLLKEIRRVF